MSAYLKNPDVIWGIIGMIGVATMVLNRLGLVKFGKSNGCVTVKDCDRERQIFNDKLESGERHFESIDRELKKVTRSVSRIEGGIEMLVKLKGMELPK